MNMNMSDSANATQWTFNAVVPPHFFFFIRQMTHANFCEGTFIYSAFLERVSGVSVGVPLG